MGICNSCCGNNTNNENKINHAVLYRKITNEKIITNYKLLQPPLGQSKTCQVLMIRSLSDPNDLRALKITYKHKITGNFEKKLDN